MEALPMDPEAKLALSRATVGALVHYTKSSLHGSEHVPEVLAAIVTGVNDDLTLSLMVFARSGRTAIFIEHSVAHTEAEAGTVEALDKWTEFGVGKSLGVLLDRLGVSQVHVAAPRLP